MSKYVIGLTGGIACGKTNVSDALLSVGAFVADADEVSRKLTAKNGAALPSIRQAFGNSVFLKTGELNKKKLADLIYWDENARKTLNGIMHPMILLKLSEMLKAHSGCAILSAPLLYECSMDSWCNEIWCVYVPQKEQLRRLMTRDALTRKEALMRIHSQLSPLEKKRRADCVIRTDGDKNETAKYCIQLYRETLARLSVNL